MFGNNGANNRNNGVVVKRANESLAKTKWKDLGQTVCSPRIVQYFGLFCMLATAAPQSMLWNKITDSTAVLTGCIV